MDIRQLFFKYRSYTPIPLAVAILILAQPTWVSYFCGLAVATVGEALRIWGVSYAGGATRTTNGVGGDVLITDGPFGYVRNPLYLGNFILSLGLCIMAWAWMPWMLLLFILLFSIQYSLIIWLEEEYLTKKFEEAYADYARHVPRFLPRLTPYRKRSVTTKKLASAFRSERSTLANFILFSVAILVRWLAF